ncbi:hypothetical protein [Paraclostridium sordellii]|uniref:hypothetical protein n=1 Tax=Paraclostridium sordellii TaxID=1505 RepID=UPI0005DAE5F3|nr:hypothetical protein [Paeniclostridium sordellii]CEP82659.1 Uncharacterised protein [[Clostridium] sordellii] [Paeniclostridium sordellii]
MCKDNIEEQRKEFKKQIEELNEKLKKEEDEEKKNAFIYKNYYIERDLSKKD